VELLIRFAARREEARGRSDVNVRDEQPFSTVWLASVGQVANQVGHWGGMRKNSSNNRIFSVPSVEFLFEI
jgi:hypothetical protein